MISAALPRDSVSAELDVEPKAREEEREHGLTDAEAVDRKRRHLDGQADRDDDATPPAAGAGPPGCAPRTCKRVRAAAERARAPANASHTVHGWPAKRSMAVDEIVQARLRALGPARAGRAQSAGERVGKFQKQKQAGAKTNQREPDHRPYPTAGRRPMPPAPTRSPRRRASATSPRIAIEQDDGRGQRLRPGERRRVRDADDVAADVARQEVVEERRDQERLGQRAEADVNGLHSSSSRQRQALTSSISPYMPSAALIQASSSGGTG